MKYLSERLYLAPLPLLQSFDICRFSYFFGKTHPFFVPISDLFALIPLQIAQLGFLIIPFKNISNFKFRSSCAWNEVSSEELQNVDVFKQSMSLTCIFSFAAFWSVTFYQHIVWRYCCWCLVCGFSGHFHIGIYTPQ